MDYVVRNRLIDKTNFELIQKLLVAHAIDENVLKDICNTKDLVDLLYKQCVIKLNIILRKNNCYQIIAESMIQLDNWSAFFDNFDIEITSSEIDIYKIKDYARYSWQYVVELCISKYLFNKDKILKELHYETLEDLFTYIVYMGYFSGVSDELHFYKEKYSDAKYTLEHIMNMRLPSMHHDKEVIHTAEVNYLLEVPDYDRYPVFEPNSNNNEFVNKIDQMLLKHFNFTINDIQIISEHIYKMSEHPVLLIDSFDNLVEIISEEISLDKNVIKNALAFVSYNKSNNKDSRNFLQRSETYRMVNFSSVILPKTKKLKSLFGLKASTFRHIKEAKTYILISPLMTVDWLDRFTYRIINGKVDYLKTNSIIKKDIIDIEKYFHIDIFEKEFEKEVFKNNILTIRSLKKMNKQLIDCGEIDLLGYCEEKNILYFFELKAMAGIVDVRGKMQVYNNYFGKKKYHEKIIKKINWVKKNRDQLCEIFNTKYDKKIKSKNISLENYNITFFSNFLKFEIKEYNILRYDEFLKNIEKAI